MQFLKMKYFIALILLINSNITPAKSLQLLTEYDFGYSSLPRQFVNPPATAQYASEAAITDLVSTRLNNESLINSPIFNFPGNGQLYNFDGSFSVKGGKKIRTLFAPNGLAEEVRRLTAYEKLEIFIDTVFGLKTGIEGCPPLYDGNIANLLQTKLTFVLGNNRNGIGSRYGKTRTRDHFSDHPDCQGSFLGIGKGAGINLGLPRQRVSNFFSTYRAVTDYQRLKVLLDIFTTIRAS